MRPRLACSVCTGEGNELCSKHKREAESKAERYGVPVEHVAWELRQGLIERQIAA